ncbi:DedA family protein [Candidatus Falkowbacteria bacterium]|uniref:VTT domain-containing protein n=1 Tax=Candidatus Falkowbacteria bacterium CG10_big_fil_rev_8_21_14_0_10_37_18 TaxID=1974562 RepID=A0A2H0V9R3_9BACT|nr:DedA family protein [Candidatus Falkowbacteria bacterium]NCQ13079.1 DedA family protein [Candidatus Falkowbacteria bacterium]OIO06410.1 MAG: hypothetical protein AUJ26_00690 [Candidatus Falkowbacteria bacterium CG1_02_37_21]PIR95803.1 MAG: hypothetical protein COT93_00455 [Candidatus Falkowbacteria bacterium CG10_big_fil_rev_8_21_14_0_10_37_18]
MHDSLTFLLKILKEFGWLGNWLFLLIAMAECVPFAGVMFPGGTLIYLASILAAQGYFNIWDVFIYASLGAILGDYLGYSLGRWGGHHLEKYRIIKPETLASAKDFFHKHGNKSIFWGRFIGPFRAVVPFIAGASKMPTKQFLFWNITSALIWASAHTALGYFSGNILARIIERWSWRLGWIALIIVIIVIIILLVKKHGKRFNQYIQEQNLKITEKLLTENWLQALDKRFPVIAEFYRASAKQGKLIAIILSFGLLLFFYLLTIILDRF